MRGNRELSKTGCCWDRKPGRHGVETRGSAFVRQWQIEQWLERSHRLTTVQELKDALIDRVEMERSRQKITITIHTAKPGSVIGRAGAGIEELNKKIKNDRVRNFAFTRCV